MASASGFTEFTGFTEYGRTGHIAWGRTGPTVDVVLLHGFSDSKECWPAVVAALRDRWGMLAIDARAHGESGLPEESFGRSGHVGDTAAVLDSLLDAGAGVRPGGVVVVGHSMGAVSAAAFAASRPGLVRAVVLEDPPYLGRRTAPGEPPRFEMPDWLLDVRALDLPARIARCRTTDPDWPDDELEPWAVSKDQLDPRMFELPGEPPGPLTEVLADVRCPVLLIHGDTDRGGLISPEAAAACGVATAGEFESVHVAGAGHSVRRDRPEPYLAALTAFLERHT